VSRVVACKVTVGHENELVVAAAESDSFIFAHAGLCHDVKFGLDMSEGGGRR
jgi:hypothetical protein